MPPSGGHTYPLTFSVDYPDRELDRLSSALRIFWVIPIAILAATIEGGSFSTVPTPGTPAAASVCCSSRWC